MTRTKKVLLGLGSVIIILMAALVVVIAVFNWNYFKPTINNKVSEAIGRPFAINGDLIVEWRRPDDMPGWRGWVPWPHVTLNDLTLGNPPWAQYRDMVSLERVEFSLSPLPLLDQRVAIREIQLTGAQANLERLRDGRTNWLFTFAEDDGEPSKWVIDIDEIGFDQGEIAYRDEILDADLHARVDPLGKPIPYGQIAGESKTPEGKGGKQAAEGKTTSAKGDDKTKAKKAERKETDGKEAKDKKVEGKETAAAGNTKAATESPDAADAMAAPAAESAEIKAALAAKPPANGDDDTGASTQVAVPEDYVFGWQVEGRYKKMAVKGDGKIGGMLAVRDPNRPFPVQADVTIGRTHIAVTGTLTDPANLGALDLRLALSGASMSDLFPLTGVTLPDTPRYATDGRLIARLQQVGGPSFHYRGFNGKVGSSDLHGDLKFRAGAPRPKLTGALSSRQLRMVDLGPLIGVQPDTQKKTDTKKDDEDRPKDAKVLPTQEFRTDRWRDMDADVALSAERVIYDEKLPITKLNVHLILDNGLLTLDPLRFGFAGGTIDMNLKLDGAKTPMTGHTQVAVRQLRLKQLFPDVEAMQRALGQLNGDVALSGTGNSVAALLGSSNGNTTLLVNDGVISKALMEIAGLNVANYIASELFGDEEVKINCGAADLQMKQGVMTPKVFVFDTENAVVKISGDVDFKNETLDLHIDPESKGIRLFSLRSPLYVKGTFAHPDAGVEVLPLAARAAGAVALGVILTPVASLLALIAPSSGETDEQCGKLLQQLGQK